MTWAGWGWMALWGYWGQVLVEVSVSVLNPSTIDPGVL
jgi:hypothetical protein